MIHQEEAERKQYIRKYVRSTQFRILSWLCAAMAIGSFFVHSYRLWLLYAAAAISFAAAWPILRLVPYRRTIDLQQKRDKKALAFVFLYVAAIVLSAVVYGLYRTSH
jgi:O-antigen ligase